MMPPELEAPLKGHRTKAELAYEYLKEEILSGQLPPGCRLTLAALATRLGTSMVPVREALMRLEREGLVQATRYKDMRVSEMPIAEIPEVFGVRAALEGYALRLAAQNESARLIEHLEQINSRFGIAIDRQDFGEISAANWEFHRFILDRAHNAHLRRLLEDIWSKCQRYRAGFKLISGRDRSAYLEHSSIIDAVKSGDLDRMEIMCRAHIERAGAEMLQYLEAETRAANRK